MAASRHPRSSSRPTPRCTSPCPKTWTSMPARSPTVTPPSRTWERRSSTTCSTSQAASNPSRKSWDSATTNSSRGRSARSCSRRRRGWGRLIYVSPGATYNGGRVGIHYSAAKGGMEALARAYALRLVKEGVTANCVAPAIIQTEMSTTVTPENKVFSPPGGVRDMSTRSRQRRSCWPGTAS
ncbi:MAG: hypothetical protein CL566_01390 [Alphaproteobacteria bacterium]|nr:hypothetical protein [Alphaproteobacteria bacterium]